MALQMPKAMSHVLRAYIKWTLILTTCILLFTFDAFFIVNRISRTQFDRSKNWLVLCCWKETRTGYDINFSYELSRTQYSWPSNPPGFKYLVCAEKCVQFPPDLIGYWSPMYERRYWLNYTSEPNLLSPDLPPPGFIGALKKRLSEIEDGRERRHLEWYLDNSVRPGNVLWLGVLRNTLILVIIITGIVSVIALRRAVLRFLALRREFLKGRCSCGYDLHGLMTTICPECGKEVLLPKPPNSSTLDT